MLQTVTHRLNADVIKNNPNKEPDTIIIVRCPLVLCCISENNKRIIESIDSISRDGPDTLCHTLILELSVSACVHENGRLLEANQPKLIVSPYLESSVVGALHQRAQ